MIATTLQLGNGEHIALKDARNRGLFFDDASKTLLLRAAVNTGTNLLPQLFLRALGEPHYTALPVRFSGVTMLSNRPLPCVTSWFLSAGSVVYCALEEPQAPIKEQTDPRQARPQRQVVPFRFLGVLRVRLGSMSGDWWSAQEFAGTPYFVARLVGGNDLEFYAIVGHATAPRSHTVSYSLARLNWSSRAVARMSPLDGHFP